MENNTHYHIPVMLQECMLGLNIQDNGIYVDVTFGGGGHAKEIFSQPDVDGGLVGGASLMATEFAAIINALK